MAEAGGLRSPSVTKTTAVAASVGGRSTVTGSDSAQLNPGLRCTVSAGACLFFSADSMPGILVGAWCRRAVSALAAFEKLISAAS